MTGQEFDDAYGVALALANALMHYASIVAQHDRELANDVLFLVREHVDRTATATAFSERDRTAIASAFDLARAAITDIPPDRDRLD